MSRRALQRYGLGALALLILGIAGALLAQAHEKRLVRHSAELAKKEHLPPALPPGRSPADLRRPPPPLAAGHGSGAGTSLPGGERLPRAPQPPVVPPPDWAPGPEEPPTMNLPGATRVRDIEAQEPKLESPQPPPQPEEP